MRLLVWNLNHRAHRQTIPAWIAAAIAETSPDVAVLTEYVEGPDHLRFLDDLASAGLQHVSVSSHIKRQNQVLIASRVAHRPGQVKAPLIDESVPPNFLHVIIDSLGLDVIGFRMPVFATASTRLKRATWEWLIDAIGPLAASKSVIAGDFNTAPGDPVLKCGDCIDKLCKHGWHRSDFGHDAFSFRTRAGVGRLIDHVFVSQLLRTTSARYSWDFHRHGPDAASGRMGRPDHALLLVDLEQA